MSEKNRYPRLNIRSKSELAKRISNASLPFPKALVLINDVLENFDRYWHDSKRSEPEKEKYVRSAIGTPLGTLLALIDKKVLAPHDHLVPDFLFGGLSEKNHIQAAQSLLGTRRGRVLVGLDITRFFEQIKEARVFYFFHKKCGCSVEAARLLARLCCVPMGPQGTMGAEKSLARGFATSSRLAVWCNLDTFLRLKWKMRRELKAYDPQVALFVDDIGITASRVSVEKMEEVYEIAEEILRSSDKNQSLPLNNKKKKIQPFVKGAEHLGLKLGRNKLAMGGKSRSRRDKITHALQKATMKNEIKELRKRKKSYGQYQKQISNLNS